ncbi:MAG: lipase family protein [Cyanobacteria bacterium P01_D01_bin.1]
MHLAIYSASLFTSFWLNQPVNVSTVPFYESGKMHGATTQVEQTRMAVRQTRLIQTESLQTENLKTESPKAESPKTENLKTENLKTKNPKTVEGRTGRTLADSFSELVKAELTISTDWLIAFSLLLIGGALSWGAMRYAQQQQWQRIEFLRQAVKEFESDPDIKKALKILDFEEYRDYQIDSSVAHQSFSFRITDQMLCNALADHEHRVRRKHELERYQAATKRGTEDNNKQVTEIVAGSTSAEASIGADSEPVADASSRSTKDEVRLDPAALREYQIETALRDWFNKLLNGLEHFGYFIESGLFTQKELQPWMNYWVKLIGDPTYRRSGASRFYDALYSYIHHSGFFGVQKLFEQFGYRILPSPYHDNDLVALNLASDSESISKSTSRYSTRVALTLAKAAYLAYQDKQFVVEVVERWGKTLGDHKSKASQQQKLDKPEPVIEQYQAPRSKQKDKYEFVSRNFRYFNNRGRDTQAYMFRTEQFMVLAFRGSQEPKDWLTNVTTQLRKFTIFKEGATTLSSYQGKVHTGFFLSWEIIEQSVLSQLDKWRSQMKEEKLPPLYITGHSLGGALATMAAASLSDNGIEVAGVYTFGQPRVGDRTFASQLNKRTDGRVFRFVNNNDIVPHVPPPFSVWNPTRLYGHVGVVKYFNSRGRILPNHRMVDRLMDFVIGVGRGMIGAKFDLISDHSMEYYISHLDAALEEEAESKAAYMIEVS